MATMDEMVKKVIELSTENSSGTLLNKTSIRIVLRLTKNYFFPSTKFSHLDEWIADNESVRGGYLVKAEDFQIAFNMLN